MKINVMLHYSQFGVQRSPNDQFDILRRRPLLKETCEFITLNQAEIPSKIGHWKSIYTLYKEIKKNKPDVIHIIGVKEGFHCVIAAFLAGVKRRILITHGFAGYSPTINTFKRLIFRWIIEPITLLLSTHIQCNSRFSSNLQMIKIFARNKTKIIYNYLQLPQSLNESKNLVNDKVSLDKFKVCTIANMHYGKGYDILQKVINHYENDNAIEFFIIGDGTLKKEFDLENANRIASGQVTSFGQCNHDKAMKILSQCSLFYLPTRFESLGNVFIEASLLAIPSVGTDVGGVSEIIVDGKGGFLIPMNDYKSAIKIIDYLRNNIDALKKMGEYSRRHVSAIFNCELIDKEILSMYKS